MADVTDLEQRVAVLEAELDRIKNPVVTVDFSSQGDEEFIQRLKRVWPHFEHWLARRQRANPYRPSGGV